MKTIRLTMAQALVRALAAQWTELEGQRRRLFAGVWAWAGTWGVQIAARLCMRPAKCCRCCAPTMSRPWRTRLSALRRRAAAGA